ncbi:4Fe-4S dicluster domain-containing protein [Desulforamulus aquiferis]|uniref:4Fe-4S dicluster domain-containing protein n=1 Tax=Desulforamulus aquiferis TaxID=1397668 RepID=A0AAW7ZH27_9FIRM|nr:4Fe-4S dicluster domain-containing protein [Desulforamulus aquiferis]MDO7788731.1 4Fe-4S dicluster domain-containing protein [Desulforamulus aquiferis]RYD05564.1 formate dehydrogenase [Desulforamulus aquiferis]
MKTYTIKASGDTLSAVQGFLKSLMTSGVVGAVLAPQEVAAKTNVVPTLIRDPEMLGAVDPFAPVNGLNVARLVANLSRNLPEKVAVVLRSCEVRALFELTKLQQAKMDNLVVIGVDCNGTFAAKDYAQMVKENKIDAKAWAAKAADGSNPTGMTMRRACGICAYPEASKADIILGWLGMGGNLLVSAKDELDLSGVAGLDSASVPDTRTKIIDKIAAEKGTAKTAAIAEFKKSFDSMDKLAEVLATCIKCQNCRQACPICFCRECVSAGPIFDHNGDKYMEYARRKGAIELPTDTTLFHLTRVNHMGLSCVGCGQCENACPMDIPVGLIFQALAQPNQDRFEYEPGRSLDEAIPITVYKEHELEELNTGKH